MGGYARVIVRRILVKRIRRAIDQNKKAPPLGNKAELAKRNLIVSILFIMLTPVRTWFGGITGSNAIEDTCYKAQKRAPNVVSSYFSR